MSKLRTFAKAPRRIKAMLFEALVLSAWFRFQIARRPFKRIRHWIGRENAQADAACTDAQLETARCVSIAVSMISGHTPWRCMCLEQAFVAKHMLARRGVPCTVYFGVRKGPDNGMVAHAWTRCGDLFITGRAGYDLYTVTGMFS